MTSSDLTALLARVEAATGPDRELDCAIMMALDPQSWFPLYTSSLDATVALVEKVRPSYDYGVWRNGGKRGAYVTVNGFLFAGCRQQLSAHLALLAALLRSMIEEEGK